jgi:hypothetical protein
MGSSEHAPTEARRPLLLEKAAETHERRAKRALKNVADWRAA